MDDQDKDFVITDVRVSESSTRAFIVRCVLIVAAIFIFGSASIGLATGKFGLLDSVMMFVEPPIFTIIGYYFRN